ncbi:hypothetical protein MRX96_012979 [Rhipicephalus microplus]
MSAVKEGPLCSDATDLYVATRSLLCKGKQHADYRCSKVRKKCRDPPPLYVRLLRSYCVENISRLFVIEREERSYVYRYSNAASVVVSRRWSPVSGEVQRGAEEGGTPFPSPMQLASARSPSSSRSPCRRCSLSLIYKNRSPESRPFPKSRPSDTESVRRAFSAATTLHASTCAQESTSSRHPSSEGQRECCFLCAFCGGPV